MDWAGNFDLLIRWPARGRCQGDDLDEHFCCFRFELWPGEVSEGAGPDTRLHLTHGRYLLSDCQFFD